MSGIEDECRSLGSQSLAGDESGRVGRRVYETNQRYLLAPFELTMHDKRFYVLYASVTKPMVPEHSPAFQVSISY